MQWFSTSPLPRSGARRGCPCSGGSPTSGPGCVEICQGGALQIRGVQQVTRGPSPHSRSGLQIEQMVWLSSRDLPLQMESQKLAPHYIGSFLVSKVLNPTAVHLQLPDSLKVAGSDWSFSLPGEHSQNCPREPSMHLTRTQVPRREDNLSGPPGQKPTS